MKIKLAILLLMISSFLFVIPLPANAADSTVTIHFTKIIQLGDELDPEGTPGDFYVNYILDSQPTKSTINNRFDLDDLLAGYVFPYTLIPPESWTKTITVPATSITVPVQIELMDYDSGSSNDRADISPTDGDKLNLNLDLVNDTWTGDISSPQKCARGNPDRGVDAELCFDITTVWPGQGICIVADQTGRNDYDLSSLRFPGNTVVGPGYVARVVSTIYSSDEANSGCTQGVFDDLAARYKNDIVSKSTGGPYWMIRSCSYNPITNSCDQNIDQWCYEQKSNRNNACLKQDDSQLPTPDSDGDALLDAWENYGVWVQPTAGGVYQKVELDKMGANANHADIFVQIDWMQDNVTPVPHDQRLNNNAIQTVVNAFENSPHQNPDGITGIHLHVDQGQASILDFSTTPQKTWGNLTKAQRINWQQDIGRQNTPGGDYLFDDPLNNTNDFQAFKETNFILTGREPIFHYVIAANNAAYDINSQPNSGVARDTSTTNIEGSDFIISIGSFTNATKSALQAGTFMHELGHNLGLRHGGDDNVNFKPNYISIMNYQFQQEGLIINGVDGNFDYSDREVGEKQDTTTIRWILDENNLDETKGINNADVKYSTKHWCTNTLGWTTDSNIRQIDWNCDGDGGQDVITNNWYDINNNNLADALGNSPPNPLTGYNDWAHLIFDGGKIGSKGMSIQLPAASEPEYFTPGLAKQISEASILVPVKIEIKPGSNPASVNPKSNGKIPVALLSTDSFNADSVDPSSVRFGVYTKRAFSDKSSLEDVNKDGKLDRVFHFNTQDTGIKCGMTSAELAGKKKNGDMIVGSDTIKTVGCSTI